MSNNALLTEEDIDDSVISGRYYSYDDKTDRVTCTLCPRHCSLKEGQRGLCFVRARLHNEMKLTTYGRSSGFCIDPIEKKPLNHFLPNTPILSFGTAGCNLTCKFCQNWDISKSREMDRLMADASPKMIAQAAKQTGCRSVAYTYNDPVIFLEYAVDVAKECKKLDIKNVAVTAGYISAEARDEFFENMDAVNLDFKAFTPEFYKKLCSSDIEVIKETAIYLAKKQDCWLEITTLLIPDENDGDDEINTFTKWYIDAMGAEIPLHFTAFHPDYKMRDKPRTPLSTLQRARDIALNNGIKHVYCGNVHDTKTATTYCPSCQAALISRDWHQLLSWNITQAGPSGAYCRHCGGFVKGIFENHPGNWGAKRQAVQMPRKKRNFNKIKTNFKANSNTKITLPDGF